MLLWQKHQVKGKDIFIYNRSCKGAIDYDDLCTEIIEKGLF